MKNGDIWLVSFTPSQGHEYKNDRPALIIQSNSTLAKTSLVTIIPLTSNLEKRMQDDVIVEKSSKNRLFVTSVAKVNCISSFDRSRFKKKIGEIEEEILEEIKNYLKIHFSL